MSFLGNIVSGVTKAVTDPGALVSDAAKAVLPKNMGAVGDILGGIADIESGHPLKALSHLADALKDLPQLAQGQSSAQAKDAAAPAGTPGAEPSPPPNKANQSSAAESGSAPPSPESPKVNVQMVGREMVISVDDGTHTTVIAEKPGQKPVVSVHLDKPPAAVGTTDAASPNSTPPASTPAPGTSTATSTDNTTPASTTPASTPSSPTDTSAPAATNTASTAPKSPVPKVNVQRIGRETITSIDDGKRTTVIVQRPGHRPIVRTHADRLPTSPVVAAGTSGTASTTTAGSTAPGAKATTTTDPSTVADTSSTSSAASTKPASTSSAAADDAAGTSGSSVKATSTAAGGSSASSAATPADLQSLMALSPDQFMQAVTSGKIPDSVANSQSAMMQVQARMNQITQMNQLVTGMMAAMHQMEMSIIQNIRC
jgi:hypothetical protein